MEDTDNDSVLMLRQMYLTSLAYKGLGQLTVPQVGSSFLEHPMDPMGPGTPVPPLSAFLSGQMPGEVRGGSVTPSGTPCSRSRGNWWSGS